MKRYDANVFFPGCLGPLSREVVLADDAAELEAEALALRDEVAKLAQYNKSLGEENARLFEDWEKADKEVAAYEDGMRNLACQLGAGGFNAEKLTAAQLVEKVQWGINNLIETQRRLLTEMRAERDYLRATRVVVPERRNVRPEFHKYDWSLHEAQVWNACLDELVRLNGKAVSEGLMRRLCWPVITGSDRHVHAEALRELRALLDERKEAGDA